MTYLHFGSVTWLRQYVHTPAMEFCLTNQNETQTYGILQDFTEADIIFFVINQLELKLISILLQCEVVFKLEHSLYNHNKFHLTWLEVD